MGEEESNSSCSCSWYLLPLLILPFILFTTAIYDDVHRHHFAPVSISTSILPSLDAMLQYSKSERRIDHIGVVELGLARARASIRRAISAQNYSTGESDDGRFVPRGAIYRNPYAFHRSHLEMEKRFKVWVYKEGEPPLFHIGPMKGVYSTEGMFMSEMSKPGGPFSARHPEEAHVFFIPLSVVNVVEYIYKPEKIHYTFAPLKLVANDYIDVIKRKHRFWNRTNGADHFMVSCHDWGPLAPEWNKGFIRVLCNANTSEGFDPRKDVSFPEINIFDGHMAAPDNPTKHSPLNRSILAFFAGRDHGPLRPILFQHWEEKDSDVLVYKSIPKGVEYSEMMRKSMFCLCPSGYEVASPRIVEAIYAGCVPVIISKAYVLPFNDVFDWSKMSIEIPIERIAEIKMILQAVSRRKYLMLYKRVLQVQKHFVINVPAQRYDVFHMTLHSLWLRRLDLRLSY
ncbi:UDP-Xyl: xylogalacturonan beta-1,3-xylosyltransferase, family GT47 [Zostera marina]|uniref:UDP-Xyl: xylogalacturonan beta-1,3-xylosyltransferase, family GT47 n=1 Tax=Zostera marina TaxID=29655 RepID=A0A0K9Q5Y3_ZOSMR|nr:UDP-Xyl: xylogalacturonan beta-1,3-xylosyltransferase, family GT47 [Zostera marina]